MTKKSKPKFINLASLPEATQEEIRIQRLAFYERLEALKASKQNPMEGFFGPDSMHWKIYREPGLGFVSMYALYLQLAHPAVAEGVYLFSNFKNDTFGRAKRTFYSMYSLFYGDVDRAIRSAKTLNHIHTHIRGHYKRVVENKEISIPFCANDPALLLWVYATIVDGTLRGYQKVYGALSTKELDQFYEETKTTSVLLGIPPDVYPPTLKMFETYFHHTRAGNELWVGASGLDISNALIHSSYAIPALVRCLIVGIMPDHICQAFKIKYNATTRRRYQQLVNIGSCFFKFIPKIIRYAPPYHQAKYRISKNKGLKIGWNERILNWVVRKGWLPFSI